ncbi:MAG: hypothetical protein IKZ46_17540, partial [Victivallales bacterium]|nr:hypothetical protein [Victivallales bacterium]
GNDGVSPSGVAAASRRWVTTASRRRVWRRRPAVAKKHSDKLHFPKTEVLYISSVFRDIHQAIGQTDAQYPKTQRR